MWVCVRGDNNPDNVAFETIKWFKKDSIRALIQGSTLSWEECRKYGWSCIKVNIHLKPVNA